MTGEKTVLAQPIIRIEADGEELTASSLLWIQRQTGAEGDVARFRLIIREPLENITTRLEVQKIRVIEITEGEDADERCIFAGCTSGAAIRLSDESQEFEARISRFHYGTPLRGLIELETEAGGEITIPEDIVFNPLLDGKVRGNKRARAEGSPVFIHYECTRTQNGRELNDFGGDLDDSEFEAEADDRLWTLAEAVQYLCEQLNPDETFIRNPDFADVEGTVDTSTSLLRNVKINLGLYLNEALDRLLQPLGYTWFVDPDAGEELGRITVIPRGTGTQVELKLQPRGELVDYRNSEIDDSALNVGLQTCINQVRVLGARKVWETTLELIPAWDPDDDDLTSDELRKDSDDWQDMPERHRVHRDWIFSEGGGAYELRDDPRDGRGDLSPTFGHDDWRSMCRKIGPMLVKGDDAAPEGENGILVEIKLTDSDEWLSVDVFDFGQVTILDQEIGIRFDGNEPPAEMIAAVATAKVRITGTVVDDQRLEYLAERRDTSPQKEIAEQVIDASDRFQFRQVSEESKNYANLATLKTDERDDSDAIETYAKRLRLSWDQADINGQVTIIGLGGTRFELGDVCPKIYGREIDLAAHGEGSEDLRYPQIVGIRLDWQRQTRTLTLETFRDPGVA